MARRRDDDLRRECRELREANDALKLRVDELENQKSTHDAGSARGKPTPTASSCKPTPTASSGQKSGAVSEFGFDDYDTNADYAAEGDMATKVAVRDWSRDPRCHTCIGDRRHTGWFTDFAGDKEMQLSGQGGSTSDKKKDVIWSFVGSLHGKYCYAVMDDKEEILRQRLYYLQKHGAHFHLSWHNGGKTGTNSVTRILCEHCNGYVIGFHPALPPKKGRQPSHSEIAPLNDMVVDFFFPEDQVTRHDLKMKRYCTIEAFHGGVLAPEDTGRPRNAREMEPEESDDESY